MERKRAEKSATVSVDGFLHCVTCFMSLRVSSGQLPNFLDYKVWICIVVFVLNGRVQHSISLWGPQGPMMNRTPLGIFQVKIYPHTDFVFLDIFLLALFCFPDPLSQSSNKNKEPSSSSTQLNGGRGDD